MSRRPHNMAYKHGTCKKSPNDEETLRFLNACAFFNRNEIEEEFINVGKPKVEGLSYRKCVSLFSGSRHISKLFTDFWLFREPVHAQDLSLLIVCSKFCMHGHHLCRSMEDSLENTVCLDRQWFPETAKFFYECVVHLDANHKQNEAKRTLNFAIIYYSGFLLKHVKQ